MRTSSVALMRSLVISLALATTAAACSSFVEPKMWLVGFVNNTDRAFILQEQGVSPEGPLIGMIVPARSASTGEVLLDSGRTLAVDLFDTQCDPVSSTVLTKDYPTAEIDAGGNVRAVASSTSRPTSEMLPASELRLALGFACGAKGWQVDVRNDGIRDVLVLLDKGLDRGPWPVPAASRSGLDGLNDASIEINAKVFDSSCGLIGSVVLTQSHNVVWLDSAGVLTAEPRSKFWEEPPIARFHSSTSARYVTQCPGG